MFDRQNFKIQPTCETIKKIKTKIIKKYIDEYNEYVDDKRQKGDKETKYITNLKDLRLFFLTKMETDPQTATYLTNVYKEGSARSEVREFSENLKLF